MNNNLTSYQQWQLEVYGCYLPEIEVDESEIEEMFSKEPIITIEINGDDDFSFHPDWAYE